MDMAQTCSPSKVFQEEMDKLKSNIPQVTGLNVLIEAVIDCLKNIRSCKFNEEIAPYFASEFSCFSEVCVNYQESKDNETLLAAAQSANIREGLILKLKRDLLKKGNKAQDIAKACFERSNKQRWCIRNIEFKMKFISKLTEKSLESKLSAFFRVLAVSRIKQRVKKALKCSVKKGRYTKLESSCDKLLSQQEYHLAMLVALKIGQKRKRMEKIADVWAAATSEEAALSPIRVLQLLLHIPDARFQVQALEKMLHNWNLAGLTRKLKLINIVLKLENSEVKEKLISAVLIGLYGSINSFSRATFSKSKVLRFCELINKLINDGRFDLVKYHNDIWSAVYRLLLPIEKNVFAVMLSKLDNAYLKKDFFVTSIEVEKALVYNQYFGDEAFRNIYPRHVENLQMIEDMILMRGSSEQVHESIVLAQSLALQALSFELFKYNLPTKAFEVCSRISDPAIRSVTAQSFDYYSTLPPILQEEEVEPLLKKRKRDDPSLF